MNSRSILGMDSSLLLNKTMLLENTGKGMIKALLLTLTEEAELGAGYKLSPSMHQSAINRSTYLLVSLCLPL